VQLEQTVLVFETSKPKVLFADQSRKNGLEI
jgi:hypothetical protein